MHGETIKNNNIQNNRFQYEVFSKKARTHAFLLPCCSWLQCTSFCRDDTNDCYFVHLLHLTSCFLPPLITLVHRDMIHIHLL